VSLLALPLAAQPRQTPRTGHRDWTVYGGGPEGIRYSALAQINRDNVKRLALAWRWDSGDEFRGSEMQCNPIVVDGVLYATTPKLRAVALDAATGKLLWSFDPLEGQPQRKYRNRGVVHWQGRIYFSAREHLIALDAKTGRPAAGFGVNGRVDLREGLGRDPRTLNVSMTTPPAVWRELLITSNVSSEDLPAAPGDIRAFDARTGALRWSFHTIPHPGEFGHDTWPRDAWKYSGAANSWAGMTVDLKRGMVFASTGSAAFDFYGANRHGDNLFANSVIALEAATGKRRWHFQIVKHDVWDRDLPTQPILVTVRRGGRLVDAVAQATKSGHIFVFERETGKPLFPIEYHPAPRSDVDGEWLAESQPLPVKPAPFARQEVTEAILTKRTPEAHKAVLEIFRRVRSGPQFTPPGFEGTFVFPGFDGGAEWGGQAFDPETGLFYVNSNEMAWILRLVPRTRQAVTARQLYRRQCAGCHRDDGKGTPPEFPAVTGLGAKYTAESMRELILQGSGRMPAAPYLGERGATAIARWLLSGEDARVEGVPQVPPEMDSKYRTDGYNKFLDPDGYPAVEPPWGTLNAISLDTGEYAWKIPFGEFPELAAKGLRNTGTENYGGPVATAGGLLFIGATNHDRKFRAYDKLTGELLWETTLPASGNATPAVYQVNGRQYVVIGAGGGKSDAPSGGSYLAFALPER
jgi:quinoprotein glucose dehydrogenase